MNTQKFNLIVLFLICMVQLTFTHAQSSSEKINITLEAGEKIWSGAIREGHLMPISDKYQFDFYANNNSNQLQPLLLSNKGLFVWSEEPYQFEIKNGQLSITDKYNSVKTGRQGKTLGEVRSYVSKTFFPASGKAPDTLLFTRPQYNTWIELNFHQNQADVLKYARSVVSNGLPPGVLMIDDTWQEDYGVWKFHPGRFPEPKKMMDELHSLGFKVMLWVCPFVSADQFLLYDSLKKKKAFLMQKEKEADTWETATEPAMIRWWDGVSAEIDFSNPEGVKWFNTQLDRLVKDYGVDGFKFDAGDMQFYPSYALSMKPLSPNEHCALYAQFGLRFPLIEYRACWKMAGQPLGQRLLDKNHTWEDLQLLVPHMIAEGLAGYTFPCPDLIGGGMLSSFENITSINQKLIIRSAQCHALMPMMQFSVAPWRILTKENFEIVKKAVDLRQRFIPQIMELVHASAKTGDPILTNLEFYFPGQGYEIINDQFMMGPDLLVAPMVKAGNSRPVVLPKGKWKADDGKIYKGGKTYKISVPIDRLPYFERQQ
jgi:alpha-glucosidase (family GH31 glycosyl hydrolase)